MITTRAATKEDAADVVLFWSSSAVGGHRPSDTVAGVSSVIARDPEALILAVDGGVIVGSLIAGWDGWRCHLYRLAVAPSHRRRRIGTLLITAAEDRFRSLGGIRADAMVLSDNDLGRAAWHAAGYTEEDDNSRWVKRL